MSDRERDIQALCSQVIKAHPNVSYTSNGDWTSCPFCCASKRYETEMDDLEHDTNCAYNIAKDLSTNLRKAS